MSRPDPAYWKLRKLLSKLKYQLPKKAGPADKEDEASFILAWQQRRDTRALLALMAMHSGFIRMIMWRAIPRWHRLSLRTTVYKNYDLSTAHTNASVEDYMQEAYMGFERGVRGYDFEHESGASLLTYAAFWIRVMVERAAQRETCFHMTGHGTYYYVADKPPPIIVSTSTYRRPSYAMLRVGHYEAMNPERACLLHEAAMKAYRTAEEKLTEREFDIWFRRWFQPHLIDESEPPTLQMLADGYKLTRERVRQIEEQMFAKLRKAVDVKDLPALWEPYYKKGIKTEDVQHLQIYLRNHNQTGPGNTAAHIDDWIVIGERTG
jgi:RNA polymerase sigma factor (sigma-70 family)